MDRQTILGWLRERSEEGLEALFGSATRARVLHQGERLLVRGLIEFGNRCDRSCLYCGLRAGNRDLERYRMTAPEILAAASGARHLGCDTIVLQSGEDHSQDPRDLATLIKDIKTSTGLAVTLSVGEHPIADYERWRAAGADRVLLKFETSDQRLYRRLHPPLPGVPSDRRSCLEALSGLGFQVGSGIMVGLPDQRLETLADDLELMGELDLTMIALGPYRAHPATPLGRETLPRGEAPEVIEERLRLTLVIMALARILYPRVHIPMSTSLLISLAGEQPLAQRAGANVVMRNLTPRSYRALYDIYPEKSRW